MADTNNMSEPVLGYLPNSYEHGLFSIKGYTLLFTSKGLIIAYSSNLQLASLAGGIVGAAVISPILSRNKGNKMAEMTAQDILTKNKNNIYINYSDVNKFEVEYSMNTKVIINYQNITRKFNIAKKEVDNFLPQVLGIMKQYTNGKLVERKQ